MKVLLVYNAMAAHKRAKKILPEIESSFNDQGILFELRLTDYPEHARQIVAEADFSRYDGVIAAGGDGRIDMGRAYYDRVQVTINP